MYVMHRKIKWEEFQHLVKFTYKNGQQASLGMIMFEALYGRKCKTLINWDGLVNRVIIGVDILKEME